MFHKDEVNKLISNLLEELRKITFEKRSADFFESPKSSIGYIPVHNYVDNSWTSYYDNRTYNNTDTLRCRTNSSKEKDDKENDETGNHPIVFLMAAGALSFGAVYLFANDNYRKVCNKFAETDKMIEKIKDKTKNTPMESKCNELANMYKDFKDSMFSKYKSTYYSKWGFICSLLLCLTYFYPFGVPALFPGILGLTGFGCYWFWNYLTNDDYDNVTSKYNILTSHLHDYKNELEKPDIPVFNPMWNNMYPSAPNYNMG